MAKLEELYAAIGAAIEVCEAAIDGDYADMVAIDAANDSLEAAYDALEAELEKPKMTKLEELEAAWAEADVAWDAYFAELDKQKENSND
jgi:hypothetical protein